MSSPQPIPNDILVDGFLSRMFSPQDAHIFFALLLKVRDFVQHYPILYSQDQDAWYITPNAPYFQPPSPGLPIQNAPVPLDFSIGVTEGTVVSQRRWAPADEVDFRRHVESVTLQLPVFFINPHGGVGFGLPDILEGNNQDLNNRDSEAPLGGRTTTFIRINWPGYRDWSRQIPLQDQTQARRPITLARFMRHVGKSVDNFLRQCVPSDDHAAYPKWAIGGEHGILQRDVKIIGAVHVSAGSWMPIIQLTRYVF